MNTKEAKEFFEALDFMAADKGIDPEFLAEKVKTAIKLAVRKQYHGINNINVVMDSDKAKFKVSISKMVVDEVEDSANEILLDAALAHSKRARLGELVEIKIDSKNIGRIAAQAAKQQIRQGVRDVEMEQMSERMGDRVGDVITARVERVEPISKNVIMRIDDNDVVLFKNEQLPGDEYVPGDMVKVYAVNISSNDRRCTLKISRIHPNFVKRMLELEVPEVYEGKIEIKQIAREAGFRTKVAVISNDPDLDPVGSCIGNRGIRISTIVNELGGEKIDVIKYSDDPKEFIAQALSPARVVEIELFNDKSGEKIAFVSVPDSQLSLAIGNRGQNAKLAAKLTGFKIDISPESGFYGEDAKSTLKEKLENRLKEKAQLEKEKETVVEEESFYDPIEEADIHAFEVENMLDDCENRE